MRPQRHPDIHSEKALSIEDVSFVVLDLETTGVRPADDEILAIGAVRMRGTRILIGQTFYRLVAPERARWDATVAVHRLRPQDVAHALTVRDVWPLFQEFCEGSVLVGYRVRLDRAFLKRVALRGDAWARAHIWIDVHKLSMWLERGRFRWPWQREEVALEELAQRYGLPLLQRHHALADALLTAQIFQRLLLAARERRVRRLADLCRVAEV